MNAKMYINDVCVSSFSDANLSVDWGSMCDENIKYSLTKEASCSIEVIHTEEIEKLLDIGVGDDTEITADVIVGHKEVQIKKHKKHRVNKKWAKRYGYRYEPIVKKAKAHVANVYADDFTGEYDGTYEFTLKDLNIE